MQVRARGSAAVSISVGVALCLWIGWGYGGTVAAATGFALVALVLAVAYVRERRESAQLERALGLEKARSRQVSDHAWQSALLTQVVDELRISPDEGSVLEIATTALVRTLKASRAVVYQRRDGVLRLSAQFASEGVTPLDEDSVLPPLLAKDRALAERLSESELTEDADPELRALAERLQVLSIVVLPVGDDRMLAVHQCDSPRAWTHAERRFIQRFADQLAAALNRAAQFREQTEDAEVRAGLLRIAHALSGARESSVVLDIATSMGAPLARSRASAILVDRDGYGFQVAVQQGFARELTSSCVRSLESTLEECLRGRTTVRVRARDFASRCPELRSVGPLVSVPLFCGHEALGVLVLEKSLRDEHWSDGDVEIAEALGNLTAAAMKNASLFEALRSAEARFADLYDNAPDLYQTVDPGGRILDCNLTQCLTLGYTKEDLVGRRFEGVLAQESVSSVAQPCTRSFSSVATCVTSQRQAARPRRSKPWTFSSTRRWCSLRKSSRLSARVVMRDVSEQRQPRTTTTPATKARDRRRRSPAASPTTSTTCSAASSATLHSCKSELRDRPSAPEVR